MASEEPEKTFEKDVPPESEMVLEDGKNAISIYCRLCGSHILRPKAATYAETPNFLHFDKKSAQSKAAAYLEADRANGVDVPNVLDVRLEGINGQTFNHFWKVKDMFDFENIAFTKSLQIDKHKYLTCADCECEIVGINHLPGYEPDPNVMYVAVSRVSYVKRVPPEEANETNEAIEK